MEQLNPNVDLDRLRLYVVTRVLKEPHVLDYHSSKAFYSKSFYLGISADG